MKNDLISRSALNAALLERIFCPAIIKAALENVPTVDAVALTQKELKLLFFAIDYYVWKMQDQGRDLTSKEQFVNYVELKHKIAEQFGARRADDDE